MPAGSRSNVGDPSNAQRQIVEHRRGALLVTGPAGSGRTEALARRLAVLAADGIDPSRVLVICRSRATTARLRTRADALVSEPYEELRIGTWEEAAEGLLRDYALEAGLSPFFATVSAADRLAIMLDRIDELPLRRHEIRGNPGGLLGRLLRRIDALKAEGVSPSQLRDWASERERAAAGPAEREHAKRELEFAELYSRHDRILREIGALDAGDLLVEMARLASERSDVREALAERFPDVMVDELEDASWVARAVLASICADGRSLVCSCSELQAARSHEGAGAVAWFRSTFPGATEVALEVPMRFGAAIRAATGAIASAQQGGFAGASDEVAHPTSSDYRSPTGSLTVGPAAPVAPETGEGAEGDRSSGAAGRASEPSARITGRPSGSLAEDPAGVVRGDAGLIRFWCCRGERAQAQATAREIEHLLAAGATRPERVCIVVGSGWREGRLLAAALEEQDVPFRFAGDAAFFQRPEVRDALAWLRMLADPSDTAAVVRALSRPPVQLRSVDLARCTTIARRRKLDMISALDAALESPQLRPEARDRIQGFLKLYAAAASALEDMQADVFVRRLIERIGLRRHKLFAATAETAERLVSLSRLAEFAGAWARREQRGSVRDFIRHVTAVADARELGPDGGEPPAPGAVLIAEPEQVKGLEFDHVYLLGLHGGAIASRPWEDRWVPGELLHETVVAADEDPTALRRARLVYVAATRARRALVLSWAEGSTAGSPTRPSPFYEAAREALGADEEIHEEELFGPAEGLHATYRMLREEVVDSSWRAGAALSEMRLDTADDVNRAVARFLELIKLSALIQRPDPEPVSDALAAVNELLGRVASPEQRAVLEASALDQYVIGEERERTARRDLVASRREPSLEAFLPRRGEGLALSASDIDLYRTCPLKYKFARVFAIPQEPTINQRFGILIHQVLERFHAEELRRGDPGQGPGERPTWGGTTAPGSLDRLLALFEAGWRRSGFGSSDDELQYRDRAVAALTRYHERHSRLESRPIWLERSFAFSIGPHQLRGRIDRVDRLPGGDYELIDYKTGERKGAEELAENVQLALYRLGASQAWQVDAALGSYWYVLEDERIAVPAAPDDAERVERTVLEVAAGIEGQDFEPRPSYEICSWCDYRLICPASEA